jgi:hypothetical protein
MLAAGRSESAAVARRHERRGSGGHRGGSASGEYARPHGDLGYDGPVSTLTSVVYRWLAYPLSLASLAGTVPSAADVPQPNGFVWEAPQACPRRSLVLQQLADVLGFGSAARAEAVLARARARASIRRDGERWVLELEVRDETGTRRRRLQSEQCTDLAHAAALALALLLKEAAGEETPPAASPSAAVAPSAPLPAAMGR